MKMKKKRWPLLSNIHLAPGELFFNVHMRQLSEPTTEQGKTKWRMPRRQLKAPSGTVP